MISFSGPISEQYKWMLTGIAAIVGVVLANLSSLQAVVSDGYLKSSLSAMVASLFMAAVAFMLSMGLRFRNEVVGQLGQVLGTPEAQSVLEQFTLPAEEVRKEMCRPFFGPLGWIMSSAGKRGANDPYVVETGAIRLIVWQAYAMWVAMILMALALTLVVLGLK